MFDRIRKKEVRGMIYKYKDAFSFRDEIGTCPHIEIDIDIMDTILHKTLSCERGG